jgi:LAO/AO transport system kinase
MDNSVSHKSALHVQKGVEMPESINPQWLKDGILPKRQPKSIEQHVEGILKGNRIVLSQAITLIESQKAEHQALAQQIIERCLPYSNQSLRIGITGTPGVGKSTFIEAFGQYIIQKGHRVAVLAIDPSSHISKGSILGDKTRMQHLAVREEAFVRPSAAGESLGGVARKTRETIVLCEAAGYDTIVIETVGVGQSETAVHSMVDFFLLLLLPGAGDELQGIKRGIVEMADLIAVNKADDDRLMLAKQARATYQNALRLFPIKESQWLPQAVICSALSHLGIDEIWQQITDYQNFTKENHYFQTHREQQAKYWLRESIQDQLNRLFYQNENVKAIFAQLEKDILAHKTTPFQAAEHLMKVFENQ